MSIIQVVMMPNATDRDGYLAGQGHSLRTRYAGEFLQRLAPLGIMGSRLRDPLKPHTRTSIWYYLGSSIGVLNLGVPQLDPPGGVILLLNTEKRMTKVAICWSAKQVFYAFISVTKTPQNSFNHSTFFFPLKSQT